MRQFLLWLIIAAVVAAIAYCVTWVFTGRDNGLDDEERWTAIEWSETPVAAAPGSVRFEYEIAPRSPASLSVAIRCEREHRCFHEQKARNAAGVSAERGPHRHLSRANAAADEQEIRDVRARHEQHETDCADDQP